VIFENRVKKALKEGKVVFGPMVSEIRTPGIAILFAQAGFDFFFIDMEHSCFSFETVSDMILAGRSANIPSIVRPPSRTSHEYLSRPLDIGAAGLLVPQIQGVKDVEKVVQWCRYQPLGERGMALSRQHTFFESGNTAESMKRLNEEVLIALQIEHRDAIESLSEILSVPGIDVAFVGPSDLSASLGKPGQANDPEVEKAIRRVIQVSKDKGVIPGIHTDSVEKAKYWAHQGMKMIGFATDIKLILDISKRSVKELHSLMSA
jgi:2-keto-3-deoxy-L-rhamnonate aldolase RhmA